jgi:hypothetical protein
MSGKIARHQICLGAEFSDKGAGVGIHFHEHDMAEGVMAPHHINVRE